MAGAKYLAECLAFRLELMLYNSRPIAILADLVQSQQKQPIPLLKGGKIYEVSKNPQLTRSRLRIATTKSFPDQLVYCFRGHGLLPD